MNDPLATSTYRYDVFVSYSQANSAWVWRWLRPRLKAAGIEFCIDRECFELGAPRLDEIERAVSESRRVLIVLSPDWVESEWNSFEGMLVQHTDPAARFRKLIPLLLEPCEPPDRIQLLHWVDLTEAETRPAQLKRVIDTIQGIDTLPELRTDAYPDAQQRRRELRWYMIGAVSALITLFVLLAWFYSQLPATTMPPGHFNIAVAPFSAIDANGEPIDHEAAIEQAHSIANYLADQADVIETFVGEKVEVWGPDQNVRLVMPGQEEELAKELNANLLLYGTFEEISDHRWEFKPEFYLSDKLVRQADELRGDYALGSAIPYRPDNLASRSGTNNALQERVKLLVRLLLGLSFYDWHDEDGYQQAAEQFHQAIEGAESGAATDQIGQEILYLFLGNAYLKQSVYLQDEPTSRAQLLSQSQQAYENAISLNQEYARSYNGLGSVLYQIARPHSLGSGNDCTWDWEMLNQADQMYEKALNATIKPTSGDVDLRANLGLGRIDLTKSHCQEEDKWAEAQTHYEQVINKYEEKDDQDDKSYLNHLALAAYAELAFIVLGQAADMEATTGQPHELPTEVSQYYQRATELLQELQTGHSQQEATQYLAISECVNKHNGTAMAVWNECLASMTPIEPIPTTLTPIEPIPTTLTPSPQTPNVVSRTVNPPSSIAIAPTLTPIVQTSLPKTIEFILAAGAGSIECQPVWLFFWTNGNRRIYDFQVINLKRLAVEPTINIEQMCDTPDQNAIFTLTMPTGDSVKLDAQFINTVWTVDQQKYPGTSYTLPYDSPTGTYTLSVKGDSGAFSQPFQVIKDSGQIELVNPVTDATQDDFDLQNTIITVNYLNFAANEQVEVGLYRKDPSTYFIFQLIENWQIRVNEMGSYSEELNQRLNEPGSYYLFACTPGNCYRQPEDIEKRAKSFYIGE